MGLRPIHRYGGFFGHLHRTIVNPVSGDSMICGQLQWLVIGVGLQENKSATHRRAGPSWLWPSPRQETLPPPATRFSWISQNSVFACISPPTTVPRRTHGGSVMRTSIVGRRQASTDGRCFLEVSFL